MVRNNVNNIFFLSYHVPIERALVKHDNDADDNKDNRQGVEKIG